MRVICILILLFISSSIAQWKIVAPLPTINDINCVKVLSPSKFLIATNKGEIILSTDTGKTWQTTYNDPSVMFMKMRFISENIGWTITNKQDRGMLKTMNGGLTWVELPMLLVKVAKNFYFNTENKGVLVCDSLIYTTSNGGISWENTNCIYKKRFFDCRIIQDSIYFVVGGWPGEMILKSTNSGMIWSKYEDTIFVEKHFAFELIFFSNNNSGYIVSGGVAKTTDQGAFWYARIIIDDDFRDPINIDGRGSNVAYIMANYSETSHAFSYLPYSTNYGDTWGIINFPIGNFLAKDISFISDSTFLVAGTNGYILKYKSMGNNFDILSKSIFYTNAKGISFLDNKNGYFLAESKILKTTDAGETFSRYPLSSAYSKGVKALNKDTVFYLTDGILYRSFNGGANFDTIRFGYNPRFKNMCFVDDRTGFITSYNYGLFATTTCGDKWTCVNSSITFEADFISEKSGWLILEGGEIYKTEDGGKTLMLQSEAGISHISMANKKVGAAGGPNGKTVFTTDGGINWINSPLNIIGQDISVIKAFEIDNAVKVFCGTSEGSIYSSQDSGKTWMIEYNLPDYITGIDYKDRNLWVVSGEKGIILNYSFKNTPVELNSFTSSISDNNVTLSWSTATEKNNYGFEIERKSLDNDYKRIGFIKGKGTATEINNYSYTDKSVAPGLYMYRLKQIDQNGEYKYYNLAGEINIGHPAEYSLSQNYPNPFNPNTKIRYSIKDAGLIKIEIFDLLGRKVTTIVNEDKPAGEYVVNFNGNNLSSGIYFYKLTSGSFTQIKKMQLLK